MSDIYDYFNAPYDPVALESARHKQRLEETGASGLETIDGYNEQHRENINAVREQQQRARQFKAQFGLAANPEKLVGIAEAYNDKIIDDDDVYKLMGAQLISDNMLRHFGIKASPEDVLKNYEGYSEYVAPGFQKRAPKDNLHAITGAFATSVYNSRKNVLYARLAFADITGDTIQKDSLTKQIGMVDQDLLSVSDSQKRNPFIQAGKWAAESSVFTGIAAFSNMAGLGGLGTFFLEFGSTYGQLKEYGASPELAFPFAAGAAALKAWTEQSFGLIPYLTGKNTLVKSLTNRFAERLATNPRFNAFLAKAVTGPVAQYFLQGVEESIQETIQTGTDIAVSEFIAFLDKEQVKIPDDQRHYVSQLFETAKAAFGSALVMGVFGFAGRQLGSVADYINLRKSADAVPSLEAFQKEHTDSPLRGDMSDEQWNKELEKIHNGRKPFRDREQAKLEAAARELNTGLNLEDESSPTFIPDRTEGAEPGAGSWKAPYRTAGGRLAVQFDKLANGKLIARMGSLTDMQGRPGSKKRAGVPYGFIIHDVVDNKVVIDEFDVAKQREGLREEFFRDFAENYAGYDIVWKPGTDEAIEFRDRLIQANPRGRKAGLSYFEDKASVEADSYRMDLVKQVETRTPVKGEGARLFVKLLDTVGRNNGMDLKETVDALWRDGIFADALKADGKTVAATDRGGSKKGATWWEETARGMRAVMWVGRNGDFSTLAHETTHALHHALQRIDPETYDLVERALDRYVPRKTGERDADYARRRAEYLAETGEKYLYNGEVPSASLKTFFDRIAEFMRNIYDYLSGRQEVAPGMQEVFDRIYAGYDARRQAEKDTANSPGHSVGASTMRAEGFGEGAGEANAGHYPGLGGRVDSGPVQAEGYDDIDAWVQTLPPEQQENYRRNKALNENRESLGKNDRKEDPKPVIEGVGADDLEGLKAKAKEGHDSIRDLANQWAARWDDRARGRPGFETQAVLKGDSRAVEKHTEEATPYNEMLDMVGFTVVVKDLKTLLEMAREVREDGAVVRVKDRYMDGGIAGYRDFLLNVRAPNGFIGEIQLNILQMYDAKEKYGGHALYEVKRSLTTEVKNGNIDPATEKKDNEILRELSEKFYGKAWGLVQAETQASASSLDMRSPSFSAYTSKNGEADKVLSAFTANNLDALLAQALSRHLTNRSDGSSKDGTSTAGDGEAALLAGAVEAAGTESSFTTVPSSSNIGQNKKNVKGTVDVSGVPAIRERYLAAKKYYGRTRTLPVNGEKITGRYVLYEAGTPTPSHDPFTFQSTKGFPTVDGRNINDRDYFHDREAQEELRRKGNAYDRRAAGQVIVDRNGIVQNGNDRTGASLLAAGNNTDEDYLAGVREDAEMYGFTAAQVAEFSHPRIDFEMAGEPDYTTAAFAKYNKSGKKSMNPVEAAVKLSKLLQPETVRNIAAAIGEHASLADLYRDKKALTDVFNALERDKLLLSNERAQYFTEAGGISAAGEEFLETVLTGSVLEEDTIRLLAGVKDVRRRLVRALAPLVENRALGEYSVIGEINRAAAIAAEVERNRKTFKSVEDWALQRNFDFAGQENRTAIAFAKRLEGGKQEDFADLIRLLNAVLEPAAHRQPDMFAGAVESKETIIGRFLDTYARVRETLAQNEKTIRDPEASLDTKAGAVADNAALLRAETMGTLYQTVSPVEALINRADSMLEDPVEREAVIRELRELEKLYPPETNRYPAPNGKPSLLLEALGEEQGRQAWYAVRTPSFKEWFGDWEIEGVADWLLTTEPVSTLTGNEFKKSDKNLKEQVREYFKEKYDGKVTRPDIGDVILSVSGIKSTIAHKGSFNRETAMAFSAVPEVIKNGKIYNFQKNWKNRGYDTYTIGAPVNIGTGEYIAEVIIKKSDDDKSYYLHRVEIKTKLHGAFKTGSDTGAPEGASKLIIAQKLAEVKGNISQVRDANGEPLPVFHGTHAQFDIFDRSKGDLNDAGWSGEGHYFYEDWSEATQYAMGDGHVMAEFINVREPYYLSDEERAELVDRDDRDYSVEFADQLKGDGYDGVYYNGDLRKEWTVFNSTQIKSTTDNAGTFDLGNPSILYQSEAELLRHAATFETLQDFIEWYENSWTRPADAGVAKGDYKAYEYIWNKAKGLIPTESAIGDEMVRDEAEDVANADDALWLAGPLRTKDGLLDFLKRMGEIMRTALRKPGTEAEAAEADRLEYLQDRIRRELPHAAWLSGYSAALEGRKLEERQYQTLMRLISQAPRDYRALYAEIMEAPEWAPEGYDAESRREVKIANPELLSIDLMSPEERERIAAGISDPKIAQAIREGTLTMDPRQEASYEETLNAKIDELVRKIEEMQRDIDEDNQKLIGYLHRQFMEAYDELFKARYRWRSRSDETARMIKKGIEVTEPYLRRTSKLKADYDAIYKRIFDLAKVKEYEGFVREAMARREAQLEERLKQDAVKAEAQRLMELRDMRIHLVRRIMRRIGKNIDYTSAEKIAAVQMLFEPNLTRNINQWIGEADVFLRGVYSQFKTDEAFRKELHAELGAEKYRRVKKAFGVVEKDGAFTMKPWEEVTEKQRTGLLKFLRKKDWARALNLLVLAKRRDDYFQMDIAEDRENQGNQGNQGNPPLLNVGEAETRLLEEVLPYSVLDNIYRRPFSQWSIEEAEELAQKVDELYVKGKRDYQARETVRKERMRDYRQDILKELRDVSRYIKAGDSGEEIKERAEKVLNRYNKDRVGIIDRIAGWHGDADIRRITRMLDNDKDNGINAVLLYVAKNRAKDSRERAITRRQEKVLAVLAENNVSLAELMDKAITLGTREGRDAETGKLMTGSFWKEAHTGRPGLFQAARDGTSQSLTVDELLYIRAAAGNAQGWDELQARLKEAQTGKERRALKKEIAKLSANMQQRLAVIFGNLIDAEEREDFQRRLDEAGDAEARKKVLAELDMLAYSRFNAVEKASDEFFARAENEKFLKVAEAVAADYRQNYERLNRMSIDEYNTPVWRVDNYVPLLRLEASGETLASQVAQDILGVSAESYRNYVNKGMLMKRIMIAPIQQIPVELGLYKTWAKQLVRTEHLMAFGGLVRTLNQVYKGRGASGLRVALENRWGKGMLKYLDDYINELANPNPQVMMNDLDRLLRSMRGKTASAYLAWKASGVIKQFITSPALYFQYMNAGEYAAAAAELAANYTELSEFIKRESSFMRTRKPDYMWDLIREAAEQTKNPAMARLHQFNQMGMGGLEFADWSCVAPGWLVIYRRELGRIAGEVEAKRQELIAKYRGEAYADILSPEAAAERAEAELMNAAEIDAEAVERADDIVRLTQPSNQTDDLAPMFKNRDKGMEAARILLQFQAARNVIWQAIRYDMPAAWRRKEYGRVVGGVTALAVTGIALGMVTQGGGDGEDKKIPQKFSYWTLSQLIESVPLIGSSAGGLLQQGLTGKRVYQSGSLLPVWDKGTGAFFGPFTAIKAYAEGDPEKAKQAWIRSASNFAEGAGYVFGLPVSGIKEDLRVFGIGDRDGKPGFEPWALWGRRD
jgi:hypothetical protein